MLSEQQVAEVAERYQGEVYGEAFYCALMHLFNNPAQKHLIGTLMQLETENKARLRQIRTERARQRMMQAVPEADVVITNPTTTYSPDIQGWLQFHPYI